MKIVVLSVGLLLLRLLKGVSCPFCKSRKNSCCFSFFKDSFFVFFLNLKEFFLDFLLDSFFVFFVETRFGTSSFVQTCL